MSGLMATFLVVFAAIFAANLVNFVIPWPRSAVWETPSADEDRRHHRRVMIAVGLLLALIAVGLAWLIAAGIEQALTGREAA